MLNLYVKVVDTDRQIETEIIKGGKDNYQLHKARRNDRRW